MKTLKDLKIWECEACGSNLMSRDEIRKEAIEHIQNLEARYVKIPSGHQWNARLSAKIEFIKYFFNITEDDLEWK